MIIKLIYSILFVSMWVSILKYRRIVKSWTWNFYWAEKYIWRWWTYFVIILAWIALILFWVTYPFGWLEVFFWPKPTI